MPQMTPAIWVVSSDARWGATAGMRWPSCFTQAQQSRLERLRQAKMLFDGEHRKYFLTEDRSQFYFPFLRLSNGRVMRMYLTCNALGLITRKSADLLLGEAPLIRSKDPIQQQAIDDLADRASLHTMFYSAATSCSYNAEVFIEAIVCNANGQVGVYAQEVPCNEIFPVGELGPDKQYAQYDRYQFQDIGTKENPLWLMLITHLMPGMITRELWQMEGDAAGGPDKPVLQLALDQWAANPNLLPSQRTGIARNTITWIPNLMLESNPVSDYDGVIELQDTLNAKQTQLSRVLAKHADPKLAVPEGLFSDEGNIDANYDVFSTRGGGEGDIPKYITWEAQLEAAMEDRKFALNQLLVMTETSPVLLGLEEGAAAEAFKTVRLKSINSLTKAARKAMYWKSGIRRIVDVCLDLENTLPGTRFDRSPIGVELRDGIPIDPDTQATTQATLKAAGLISLWAAVEERYSGDAAATAIEVQRIRDDAALGAPSITIGSLPPSHPLATPANAANPSSATGDDDQGAGESLDAGTMREISDGNVDDAVGSSGGNTK